MPATNDLNIKNQKMPDGRNSDNLNKHNFERFWWPIRERERKSTLLQHGYKQDKRYNQKCIATYIKWANITVNDQR